MLSFQRKPVIEEPHASNEIMKLMPAFKEMCFKF